MTSIGDRIDQLSPEKRTLLEQQLLKRRAQQAVTSGKTLPRRQPGQPTPLSFAQQQLWFLDQWQPGGSAYNASLNIRFDGPLDTDCLRRAFDTIVERHETLRAVVVDDDGIPSAQVLVGVGATIVEIDLGAPETPVPDEVVAEAVRKVVRQPFDLATDVMLRVGLIRLSERSHVVCMVLHHIACDGWSRGILFDELSTLYNAYLKGLPSPLPDLTVQYGDYAAWQHSWLRGDVLKSEIDFWKEELSGADLVFDVPVDHPRPPVLEFKGGRIPFTIPASVATELRRIGREERATMYMVVHAATGVLLNALSGQEDLLVGSPVGHRRWPETEALIGLFVNTVVLRLRMRDDPTFRALLQRCRATAIDSYTHQELPFECLVQALRPKRRSDRNPIFQVNLRVQGRSPEPPALTGLTASRVSVGLGSSRFDLALGFEDGAAEVAGYVEFNSALFDAETVEGWITGFGEMLGQAAADPDLHLAQLAEIIRQHTSAANNGRRRRGAQ